MRCRALLFDLDGVLVDSSESVERHWAAFAARTGVDLEAIRPVMHGRRSPDTIREVAPHLDAGAEGRRLDREQAQDGEGLRAIPGAAELLASLPAGRWAVVTSGPRVLAEARLRAVGLPVPAVLVDAHDVERGKPDPAGYLAGAQRLGVAPADCVVVEDAPPGVAAGRAAGMRVLGVLSNQLELDGVEFAVPDLRSVSVQVGEELTVRQA